MVCMSTRHAIAAIMNIGVQDTATDRRNQSMKRKVFVKVHYFIAVFFLFQSTKFA